jgi:hypothetical protein
MAKCSSAVISFWLSLKAKQEWSVSGSNVINTALIVCELAGNPRIHRGHRLPEFQWSAKRRIVFLPKQTAR